MPKLVVHAFTQSLDGYSAGPGQDLENPMGRGAQGLHQWAFATATFRKMFGQEGGGTGLDDAFARRGFEGIGATIMGRNMFGPVRGAWPDQAWKGWWGEEPPFHHPVFVLTHHAREAFSMAGGTSFHFVNDGIESALKQAFAAAKGGDVRVGGGAATIRQYLRAGLIDELNLVVVPLLLGSGERIFEDGSEAVRGYECAAFVASEAAMHVRLVKRRP